MTASKFILEIFSRVVDTFLSAFTASQSRWAVEASLPV